MTQATPESSDSLVFECDFDEPPEKVWRALTEPRLLDKWLTGDEAPPTDFEQDKGASGHEQCKPAQRRQTDAPDGSVRRVGSSDYEVVTAEPHRLLRYRWRDRDNGTRNVDDPGRDCGDREVHSVVTVELAPGPDGGTHLRLTHGGFTIVSAAPSMTAASVRPITSARRVCTQRIEPISLAPRYSWRRAA